MGGTTLWLTQERSYGSSCVTHTKLSIKSLNKKINKSFGSGALVLWWSVRDVELVQDCHSLFRLLVCRLSVMHRGGSRVLAYIGDTCDTHVHPLTCVHVFVCLLCIMLCHPMGLCICWSWWAGSGTQWALSALEPLPPIGSSHCSTPGQVTRKHTDLSRWTPPASKYKE